MIFFFLKTLFFSISHWQRFYILIHTLQCCFPLWGQLKSQKGKKQTFSFFYVAKYLSCDKISLNFIYSFNMWVPHHGTIKSHNWNVISWSSYKPLNYKAYMYYKKPMGFSQGWRPREITCVKCGLEYFLLFRSKSKCITYKVNLSAESDECKL